MTRLHLFSAVALLAVATGASASSFVVTTDAVVRAVDASSNATTNVSNSTFKDKKIILAARDDAASFVASKGDIRGVHLEAALDAIHQQLPQLNASDAQLAEAILSF
ncbi:DUF2388 domain-containing protein [Pseudomonas sp. NA-150]|uniref:DUF2388 domain-containing protein n=1 Tax=Pseudomonas sp. NA-150 TaxID=3367525 RepID=UPI0037C9F976